MQDFTGLKLQNNPDWELKEGTNPRLNPRNHEQQGLQNGRLEGIS